MQDKRSSRKAPPFSIMHVALLLLCVVMLTIHLTGGLNARYVSSAEGSDSARVAKFDVSCAQTGEVPFDIQLEFLDPKKHTDSISFTVASQSEVTVAYDVILELPETLYLLVKGNNITVQMDEVVVNEDSFDDDAHTVTIEGKTLGIGENNSFDHTITFRVNTMPNDEIMLTGKAILRIHAEQLDSGGRK